jgi:hypothetical protein
MSYLSHGDDRVVACSIVTIVSLLLTGCSGEVPTYKVRGQVVYADDGQPVPGGVTVVFESVEPPYRRASGDLDAEGRFELSTTRQGDGAMEGKQRIRFTAPVSHVQPDPNVAVAKVMDSKFCDFATSGITVDIKPDDNNTSIIKVERPRGGVKGPPAAAVTKQPPPDRSQDAPNILSPDLDIQ